MGTIRQKKLIHWAPRCSPLFCHETMLIFNHLSSAKVDSVLAFLISLFGGRAYHWRPELDVSDPFVLCTLFADGAH